MPDAETTDMEGGVPLAEMIQVLRGELERAQAGSTGSSIRFETERVELELQVAVSDTSKGKAGIQFWVVKAGGELERSGTTTHTFRLTLFPVSGVTKERVVVSGRSGAPIPNR